MPVFAHGVASFDPHDDRVLLWTRVADAVGEVDLVVARNPELGDVVHRSSHHPTADSDWTVAVDVDGLEPATSYWYRFEAAGARSPVGRTRTMPGKGAGRFRLGFVCCARYSVAPLGVYRALADREVDLVVHLGDYIYEDDGDKGPRSHDPPRPAITLDDYRRRIAQIRADPDAQALHMRHPVSTIWDDHDLSDNAWRTGAKHHDPDRDGPWEARVRAAAQARREWLPSRTLDPDDPLVTWRSIPVGDLAELVLLDTRFAGRDRQAGDEESPSLDDPDRSLLGDAQRQWLGERMRGSEQPWAIVCSGVVVNKLELPWPRPLAPVNAVLPNGYAVLDGRVLHDDQWDGYPAERRRLAGWARERGERGVRTFIVSGDVHSSWAFVGPCDEDTGRPVAVEMTVPAVSSAAMGRAHYPGISVLLDRAVRHMDHVCWAEVTRRGYGILDLTPSRAQAEWWFVQPYDEDPGAGAELGAGFVTERDEWPPSFREVERATDDPERRGPPELPPRPDDLPALRRARRRRLAAEGMAGASAIATVLALAATWVVRRRSRP